MAYRILDHCVGCLKCVVECPKQAIYLTEDAVVIAPEKCISCGKCASICNECAPVDESAEQAASASEVVARQQSCDVLVLGGGGAGMVAAARAAYKTGLSVIVAEKGQKTGGGAWYAADFKMFNSKWQKEHGIPDCLEEELLKAMDNTYWKLSPNLARDCYEATGQFFDWVCESGDKVEDEFREGFYIFDGPNGPKVPVFKKMRHGAQGGTGKFMMDQMLRICQEEGVQILTATVAERMVREGDRISQVILKDAQGEITVNAKEVILATGSWIENQKLLEKIDDKFAVMKKVRSPHRSPKYTGDGLRMAEEIGVPIDYDSMCLRLMGPLFMPTDGTSNESFRAMTFEPTTVWINLNGQRWINESFGGRAGFFSQAIPLREQPKGYSFMLFDANCVENAYERGKKGESVPSPFPIPKVSANWKEELSLAAKDYGYAFFEAGSLEELAEKCGMPAAALKQSMDRYNENCAKGFDPDFCKTPGEMIPISKAPFYALRCEMATDGAFGGMPIASDLRVKLSEDHVLENLYAAGDITNGRYINQGGIKVQIINDLAWAFASGYLAAEKVKAKP